MYYILYVYTYTNITNNINSELFVDCIFNSDQHLIFDAKGRNTFQSTRSS